ncbi:type IV toxin-antitoxin system AbiEi family antitoxin domain-containing protein [Micromonospora sp. RP3T]|uniref:type IV toxin-antitoxin system AbiEi family antitoxin domain-containing protein n=1 Tax=Micromonospora sp. RP3T TaxID=2135446 RepID=UPI003D717F05
MECPPWGFCEVPQLLDRRDGGGVVHKGGRGDGRGGRVVGLWRYEELRASGVSRGAVRHRVEAGRLGRLSRGVYGRAGRRASYACC